LVQSFHDDLLSSDKGITPCIGTEAWSLLFTLVSDVDVYFDHNPSGIICTVQKYKGTV